MSSDQGQQPPKLIIDSDWKAQAQAEKERLSAQTPKPAAAAKPAVPGAPAPAAGAPEEGVPQEVGFQDLVSLLVTQALVYLGAFPDPKTGQAMVALDYAKLHIDMLGVLEEKTKGNLSESEAKLISRAVGELRMEFVEVAKAVQQAIAQGKIKPQQVGAMGGIGPAGVGGGASAGVPQPKIDFGAPGMPKA